MAKSRIAYITIVGPAPYSVTFSGSSGPSTKVHKKGHLWLWQDDPGFTITFKINPGGGYVFDDGGTGNAEKAIFLGGSPNPNSFSDCNGVFGLPALSDHNTRLDIQDTNTDAGKYFYRLNFLDGATPFHVADPLIIND